MSADPRDDTETPPELPDDTDSPAPSGPIVASYQIRVHLRRGTGMELTSEAELPPVLAEVEALVEDGFSVGAPGFTVSVSAERIDR